MEDEGALITIVTALLAAFTGFYTSWVFWTPTFLSFGARLMV